MKSSIYKYFHVGTLNWMSYPPARCDILESIEKIACDEFFTAIEISHIEDEKLRGQVAEVLQQSGLRVCFAAHPQILGGKLNPNALDEGERKRAEEVLLNAVDEAALFGAEGMSFLSGRWSVEHQEDHYGQLVKTTSALCEYAAQKGMHIELEAFDYDVDKKALIGPAPLAARFAADVRSCQSNFGMLVDLSHIPLTHEDSRFVVQTLRPYITHFHYGNAVLVQGADAYGDLHPCFGYPGGCNGVAELEAFLRVLKQEGFFRKDAPMVLSMEVTPRPNQNADIVIANTKRALTCAWARL